MEKNGLATLFLFELPAAPCVDRSPLMFTAAARIELVSYYKDF
jgi:hypothetical protein